MRDGRSWLAPASVGRRWPRTASRPGGRATGWRCGATVEVLRHYREIAGLRRQIAERLLLERPDGFIGIDAPDFNLGLEARLKQSGIKAIHFVCPSIWAWRGKRVNKMAQSVDHVLCLFPFEPALLRKHAIDATYVGHPLADAIPLDVPRDAARAALDLSAADTVVALLPGSRRSEIQYIAPSFLQAAARMHRAAARPALPAAGGARAAFAGGADAVAPRRCGADHAARRPFARGARRLRRDADRQRHRHARSGAVQAADGDCLPHECPELADDEAHADTSPGSACPTSCARTSSCPSACRATRIRPRWPADVLAWLDAPAKADALARRFTELHHLLRRDTARTATDAIAQVLAA